MEILGIRIENFYHITANTLSFDFINKQCKENNT